MARVLVVGAGLTGGACAALLRGAAVGRVSVWDKARGAGGRMSTSRSARDAACAADLGAQYVTLEPERAGPRLSFYEELLAEGILQPLTAPIEGMVVKEGSCNYMAPQGMSSLVKYYLKQSVIQESQRQQLEAVSYSSRYALALFYEAGRELQVPWAGRYLSSDPWLRFICIDSRKRGAESPEVGPSVVVHTTVTFGSQHLESDPAEVQQLILSHLEKLVPALANPASIKCHKWRYSQVTKAVPSSPGGMILHTEPLLLCGGDGFTHSTVDGCLQSAVSLAEAVRSHL
ncbi:renalase [Dryobates pubescens]|uniref:renalase n=1 Tax=Dryobates pubescens TaxID=118200 RepID=UPI0023B9D9D7|nr:renalase [Dryobates pubescens]